MAAPPLLSAPSHWDRPRSSSFTSTPTPSRTPSPTPPSPNSPSNKKFLARILSHRPSVSLPSLPSLPNLRTISSEVSGHLPKFLSGSEPQTPPWSITNSSIAPPTHRENTALHALMDSLPVLPTLSGRSLPSFNFNTPSLPSFLCLNPSDSGSSDEDEVPGDKDKDIKDDPLKRLTGNVVVLGGYRGSILRDAKTLKRIWIPLRVGFGLRKPDLAIGLTDEAELRSRETVVPGRMLMAVGGVIDLGKRLKDKLKHLSTLPAPPLDPSDPLARPVSKLNFVNWGYDWRRRLELSSEELLRDLEQMKRESKARGEGPNGEGEGATVIAHSMGGLVTLHALARASDPTVFKGIIFAGTPFGGCVNVLGPLRRGDGVLFNREICSPSVVFSMRSSFYFLPFSGLCFETPSGESLPVNFFDPKSWSDLNLSPVAGYLFDAGKERQRRENREGADRAEDNGVAGVLEPSMGEDSDGREDEVEVPEVQEEREGEPQRPKHPPRTPTVQEAQTEDALIAAYLSKTLERVQIFHSELTSLYDPTRAASYPPMCILTSQKTATVRGVISPSYDSIAANPYDHLLFGAGDGIVLYESAKELPGGPDRWNRHLVGVEESAHGHVSLLGDLSAIRRCLGKLYG